jgi:hypothetical protein
MEYIVTDQMREWGKANGYNVDLHVEYFNDYLANRTGKPYRSLDAAFRTCVRADWGDLRKAQRYMQPPLPIRPDQVVRANTFIKPPTTTAVPAPEGMAWRRKA